MNVCRIFLFATIVSSSALALDVYTDVESYRIDSVTDWQEIAFHQDHSDRQPTQRPKTWTNLTIALPYWAEQVQFTARDEYGSMQSNRGGHSARIPFFNVSETGRSMNVSFVWWGIPWTVYRGFSPYANMTH